MKPLLICDCDEVLLHMVRHFGTWLDEAHAIDFDIAGGDFMNSMTRRDGGPTPGREEMWAMLNEFFPDQMHRQTLVPHAAEALARIGRTADIVILTNLQDDCRVPRIEQLGAFGIAHRVETNQGGKGDPVARLVAEYGDPVTVFVDDLAVHHESVSRHAPDVHRLHMISEPALAPTMPPAPHANARIDDWREAADWIEARFAAGLTATGARPKADA
jgi:hypothetical protein